MEAGGKNICHPSRCRGSVSATSNFSLSTIQLTLPTAQPFLRFRTMSGLSRHMSLSARSFKSTSSSVPTISLRLPGKYYFMCSQPQLILKVTGARRYGQASLQFEKQPRTDSTLPIPQQTPHWQEHLNQVFSPLQFPKELAKRLLTHSSHNAAASGHNARFSFLGVFP